jgi:hypothetical protein
MRRLTIVMSGEERAALDKLATNALRDPRDYMRFLLRDVASSKGQLPRSEGAQDEGEVTDREERRSEYAAQ